jgi:signal transduction histidine kinase
MLDELKSSRDQLERRTAETVSAMHLATIGELTSGVAHEINNPINGIINYAQILSDRLPHSSKEQEIADRIIKEGNRIAVTVSGLLSFARSDSHERLPVKIGHVISEAMSLTREQIQNDGIQLKIDVPDNLPKVKANSHQIEEVFLNLLSNARYALNEKYNGNHDDKIIEIKGERIVRDNSPFLRVVFLDHGTGIPSAILNKVTAPFFTTKPAGLGTGLGLNISRRIIYDHGGTMKIESEEGKFTQIAMTLPAT